MTRAARRPQTWLAARLEVGQAVVSHDEHGQTRPRPERLAVYAAVLGVDPAEFFAWRATRRRRRLARLAGMAPRVGPRKYDPLVAELIGLAVDEVRLTFPEIERIVDAPLPPSARQSSFWTQSPRALVARPWLRAGWRVVRTELHRSIPAVTFVRMTMPPRPGAR